MTTEENIYLGRIVLKNDSKENWDVAESFIPRKGEAILFLGEEQFRSIKIGDGTSSVGKLPLFFNFHHGSGEKSLVLNEDQFETGFYHNEAQGAYSIAGGRRAFSNFNYSFAFGEDVIVSRDHQAVFGKFNKEDKSALFIVGNGYFGADDDGQLVTVQRNAFAVHQDGIEINGKKLTSEQFENLIQLIGQIELDYEPV